MIKAGDILIAKPFLQDGHFKRSVIYLCEHNNEGSLGFITNKSHGMILRDIFPHLKTVTSLYLKVVQCRQTSCFIRIHWVQK